MATKTVVQAPIKNPEMHTVSEIIGTLLVIGMQNVAILAQARLMIKICTLFPLSDLDPSNVEPMTPANRKSVTCNEADSFPICSLR